MLDVDCFNFDYLESKFCYYRFYRSKTKRQDAKNKCCILIIVGICCTGNCPEAFLSCFVLCELGVIPVLVNTIPDT